jgi:hypothetical protein
MNAAEQILAGVTSDAFDHDSRFARFGPSNFWMRFLVFLNDFTLFLLRRSLPAGRRARAAILPLLRLYEEHGIARPDIQSFIKESALELAELPTFPIRKMQWAGERIPAEVERIPTMLEVDALRFYTWIGRTLDLGGTAVELGSWMGASTASIALGLRRNKSFRGRKLHVFDTFIWQDWMSQYSTDPALSARYSNGDCFIDEFLLNCKDVAEILCITRCRPETLENEGFGGLNKWDGGPIGVIVIDHSDQYQANVQAWSMFAPSFVANKTVVIFNQYGNLRAEELRRFCRDRRRELKPLYQLDCSGRAFQFVGM